MAQIEIRYKAIPGSFRKASVTKVEKDFDENDREILRSHIANLSFRNPGAYYELIIDDKTVFKNNDI